MILDERSYAIWPQYVKDYLRIYETEGMALQVSHLGDLIGWFTTDTGTINEVVHIWRYADADVESPAPTEIVPRAQSRTALAADFDTSIMAMTERIKLARYEQRRQERKHKLMEDGTPEAVANDMEKSGLATAWPFRQITGVGDLRQIRPGHLSMFRDGLQRLRNSWRKRQGETDLPIAVAWQRAATLAPDKIGFAVSTIRSRTY